MPLFSLNDKEVCDELRLLYEAYNREEYVINQTPEGKSDIYECLSRYYMIEQYNPTSHKQNWVLSDAGKNKCIEMFKDKIVCSTCGK